VPCCTQLSGRGQFLHAFSGEAYDFYSVSAEYFEYTLVYNFYNTFSNPVYRVSSDGMVFDEH
jgi:hypothetical protein